MNKTDVIFGSWRMFAKMMKGQPQGRYFERKLTLRLVITN